MAQLRLSFLGAPQITQDETNVEVKTRKAVALLAYLAVTGEMHSRDSIATLLWPQFDQQRARASLRNALSLLKKAIGADRLCIDRHAVALNCETDIVVDVRQFRSLQTPTNSSLTDNLVTAVTLYRDDFLAGFTLRDSPLFDEWQFFETERLRQGLGQALEALINQYQTGGKPTQALPYAQRQVQLSPLHEPAHYQLMKLYAQTGQQAAALRQFDLCTRILAEELGISPQNETVALYKQIRQQPSRQRQDMPPSPLLETTAPELSIHHLPVYATSFVGRQTELAQIAANLASSKRRLITITGIGGIGKTRLTVQAVSQLATQFADGVFYIDLAPLRSVHQLLPTIMAALSLPLHGPDAPQEQLVNYLQPKKLLLVLDNFEHLVVEADVILQLLHAAPDVYVLITSREILNLSEEWVYPLRGLPVPDKAATGPAALFSSVQLFIQRARQLRPDFTLATEEKEIVKICQLVEGMPLGIELAAAWVRLLPCVQIAQEIENNIDFLTNTRRDTNDRHHSLRAVFAHSWALLLPTEQQTFAQFSLFRGGATLAAVQAVTQAPLFTLYGLVNKSLLQLEENGRYTVHELLRQFAAEKLAAQPAQQQATRARYCHYYASWLKQNEPQLFAAQQEATLNQIQQDIENIRQAWDIANQTQNIDALKQSLHSLYCYHTVRSDYATGQALFQQAADSLAPHTDTAVKQTILAKLLARQGEFAYIRGQADEAKTILQKSLAYAESMQASHEIALCYRLLGLIAYRQGFYHDAHTYLTQAIPLTRQLGEEHNYALLLLSLGAIEQALGRYDKAEAYHTTCLTLYQQLNYQWGVAHALRFLGKSAYLEQAFAQAQRYYEESCHLSQTIKDEAGTALALSGLGLSYLTQAQYETAHEVLQTALTLSHISQTESVQAEVLKNLGLLMIAWQEPQRAQAYLREALHTAVSAQATPIILEILLEMTQIISLAPETVKNIYTLVQRHPATDWMTKNKARQWQKNLPDSSDIPSAMKIEEKQQFTLLIETCLGQKEIFDE